MTSLPNYRILRALEATEDQVPQSLIQQVQAIRRMKGFPVNYNQARTIALRILAEAGQSEY